MTITLVGDVDQMLYRFAGAQPELMAIKFSELMNVDHMELSTNYRSTQEIISRCSRLIAHNYEEQGGPYPQHLMKTTQPREDAPEGDPIQFRMYANVREESEAVAQNILEQMETEGYEYGDFYVGSRTRAQIGYLEGPLFRAGIKFVNITGGSFWEGKHAGNVIGFLRLAYDISDNEAFQRVFNIASASHTDKKGDYCHHHWMGQEFLRLTKGSYSNMHLAIEKNRRYYYGVEDLRGFINDIQAELAHTDDPGEVIRYIMDNCYYEWLKATGDAVAEDADSSILDDMETVMEVASEYATIGEFLDYVKDMINAAKDAKDGNLDDYVVLSTLHRLKGSERTVMMGVGWCEGQEYGLLPHTFSKVEPPQFGVLPTGGMAQMEDERCIAFVCVSRAKLKVFLSGVRVYRNNIMEASRFIAEMGILELLDEVAEQIESDIKSLV